MKKFLGKYLLYIYLNFIKDNDIGIYKKWVIPFMKKLALVRGAYMWILSLLFFPIFLIGMNIDDIMKNNKVKKAIKAYKIKNIYINLN